MAGKDKRAMWGFNAERNIRTVYGGAVRILTTRLNPRSMKNSLAVFHADRAE
jgi:hypothetical protein